MQHPYLEPVARMYAKIQTGSHDYTPTDPEFETAEILLNYHYN